MRNGLTFLVLIAAVLMSGCEDAVDLMSDYHRVETTNEHYIENYDETAGLTLEAWYYQSDGTLEDYSVYSYDAAGNNTLILTYNSETVLDTTTLIQKIVYGYDADGNRSSGELYTYSEGIETKEASFAATYNAVGNYLDYVVRDDTDTVVEHRVCTYDETGDNYLTETYYSDGTTAPESLVEEYTCAYDAESSWKWIREDHFYRFDQEYERDLYYLYGWNGDTLYSQTDWEAESGEMVMTIIYHYDPYDRVSSRSYLVDGKVMVYWTYQYDSTGELIELCYYSYTEGARQLNAKETFAYYITDDGDYVGEMKTYSYTYADKSVGLSLPEDRLWKPKVAHHCEEVRQCVNVLAMTVIVAPNYL